MISSSSPSKRRAPTKMHISGCGQRPAKKVPRATTFCGWWIPFAFWNKILSWELARPRPQSLVRILLAGCLLPSSSPPRDPFGGEIFDLLSGKSEGFGSFNFFLVPLTILPPLGPARKTGQSKDGSTRKSFVTIQSERRIIREPVVGTHSHIPISNTYKEKRSQVSPRALKEDPAGSCK